MPFPFAVATIGRAVSHLARGFERFPFCPFFPHALLLGAFPFGNTVMMPALKKLYPTYLVAPVHCFSLWAVCPVPYFTRSIRLLCLR